MLSSVLIANRGEIACRVVRAAQSLGIESVAVFAPDESEALHVALADRALPLSSQGAAIPYLDGAALLDAAIAAGVEGIHPGYGFLSESADFAEEVVRSGLVWIGPRPETIALLGDKRRARELAVELGIPVVPGTDGPVRGAEDVVRLGRESGWPVLVKATMGGGGRGMRVVESESDVADAIEAARRESRAAFGDDTVLAERFLAGARHVEVQILGDTHGRVLAVGDRECSVQRRHQKVIEEAPASAVPTLVRDRLAADAERLMRQVGYVGAGTVEFLVSGMDHYFLEVNTRIQVEHPVTEAVTGLDLVAEQLRICSGEALALESAPTPRGHAIEVRVNAEDPLEGFAPASGRLREFSFPQLPGVRLDTGYRPGDAVSPRYDSLLAKVIAHRPDRDQAVRCLLYALRGAVVSGIPTTMPALVGALEHKSFRTQDVDTQWFEEQLELILDGASDVFEPERDLLRVGDTTVRIVHPEGPARLRPARVSEVGGSSGTTAARSGAVLSPMIGTVLAVHSAPGQAVLAGDPLVTVEAMKMENIVRATAAGVVADVLVRLGDDVQRGTTLLRMVETADDGV